jgi:radical SAM superfamily enzyme YgiQ (UPF0313 family)
VNRSRPKLALVVPRTDLIGRRPALRRLWESNERFRNSSFFFPLPNLGLLTLAALAGEEFEISYLDENVAPLPFREHFDVVALTSMTCQAPRAYRLARRYRAAGAHTVLGGIHPTVLPGEAGENADTVVAGEGESTWPRFLRDFLAGRPQSLYRADRLCDLALQPVPRYDLVPGGAYRAIPLQAGRGCSLGCEFCSVGAVHGTRYRHKTLEQVREEIAAIRAISRAPRPRVFFTDDNLHLHRPFLGELLEAVAPLRINWMAQMDAAAAKDPELLELMARSGCTQLLVGFESLNPANIAQIQQRGPKRTLCGEYGEIVRSIQSRGIRVLGMFIVGLDDDRPGVFGQLREFVLETKMHDAQITIQTPLPGTALRRRLERAGRLRDTGDWSRYSFFDVLYAPVHLTRGQILRGQTSLYREIHAPEAVAARQRHWLEHFRERAAGRPR